MKRLLILMSLAVLWIAAEAQTTYSFAKNNCRLEISRGSNLRFSMLLEDIRWADRIGNNAIEVWDGVTSLTVNDENITSHASIAALKTDLTTWRLSCLTRVSGDTLFIGNDTILTGGDGFSLAGSYDYITKSGSVITRNQVDLATDVTGNLPIVNLGGGVGAAGTTFWRGDNSWAIPQVADDVTPQLGGLLDVNGQSIGGGGGLELLKFKETVSAVNEFTVENAATGNGPILQASGDDANVDLDISPKGTGDVILGTMTLDGDQTVGASQDNYILKYDNGTGLISLEAEPVAIAVACSDLTTDLTTGTSKGYFRAPYAFTLTEVRASVLTAPVGSTIEVDINESGVSVLSTVISIDANEKTSETAATPPVISDSAIGDDSEITIDIDQIGASTAGAGLIVWLIGTK